MTVAELTEALADAADTTASGDAHRDLIHAFQEVGDAILAEVDLDELLHLVIRKVCGLLGVQRGSLYLRDTETGLFIGQVGEWAMEIDDRVKRLTCGGEADRFTQEILATKAPVLIADAQHDPRPVRSTMRDWEVRSILGVPMIAAGEVTGLLFLDNVDQPHRFSRQEQDLAAAFANMAAVAITTARRAEELRQSVRTVARQNTLLRQAAVMEEKLTALALRGGTVNGIVASLAALLGKPCAAYDASFRPMATASAPRATSGVPRLFDDDVRHAQEVRAALTDVKARRSSLVGPFPRLGVHHRCLVVPIVARDDTWGYVVVGELGSRLTTTEMLVASRAAAIIALKLSFERSTSEAKTYAREALVRRLIESCAPAVVKQAEFHGLRPSAPHVVAILEARERTALAVDLDEVCAAAERVGIASLWPARIERDAVAMIIEIDSDKPRPSAVADLRARLASMIEVLRAGTPTIAAISRPCSHIHGVKAAYAEARQVLDVLTRFGDGPRSPAVLSADELGAARLLLATADRIEVDRIVQETLGPVANPSDADPGELLLTLQTFLACAGGIRRTAAALHVHENTVRYRLSRLTKVTGLDVLASIDHQAQAHLALLILRLEGRLSP